MIDPEQHLVLAAKHLDAGDQLSVRGYHAWAVVAIFYLAMHMVHAGLPFVDGLTTAQQYPESHSGRIRGQEGTTVVVTKFVPSIGKAYRSLFDASVDVRYKAEWPHREVASNHRHADLPVVARWACRQVHGEDHDCWLLKIE